MLAKSPIFCFKETKIRFAKTTYVFGQNKGSKALNDRIMRQYIKKGKGKWFQGKVLEADQSLPERASDAEIEYDFRTQGLICGYCGCGTISGHYFKPQSLGMHLQKSCIKLVPSSVIQENKNIYKKNYKTWKMKKGPSRECPSREYDKVWSQAMDHFHAHSKPSKKVMKAIYKQIITDTGAIHDEIDEEMVFEGDEYKNSPRSQAGPTTASASPGPSTPTAKPLSQYPPSSNVTSPSSPANASSSQTPTKPTSKTSSASSRTTILSDSNSTTSDNEESYELGPNGAGWCNKCYTVRPCDLCENCAYYRTCKNRNPKLSLLSETTKVSFLPKESGVKDREWEWIDGEVGLKKFPGRTNKTKILKLISDKPPLCFKMNDHSQWYLLDA